MTDMVVMGSRRRRRARNARVGAILAQLRSDAAMTQPELARLTGITTVRICRLESGFVRLLAEEIPPLCSALGVGAHRFLPCDGERA